MVRPGQLYKVFVIILKEKHPITVRASIQRDGVEVVSHYNNFKINIPETLLMKVILKRRLNGVEFTNNTKILGTLHERPR